MSRNEFQVRISILQKIMIPMVLLFLAAIGIGAYLIVRTETRSLTKQLINSAEITNRNIASVTQSAFWSLGWVYLEEFLHDLGRDQGNIIFAKVVNPDGEVYLADSRKHYGRKADPSLLGKKHLIIHDYYSEEHGEKGVLLVQPLTIGKDTWHILTAISLKDVREAVSDLIKRTILPGLLLLLMTAGGAYFIARAMSRPIVELAESAEAFARGDLKQEVQVGTRDEVGLLSHEFNRMVKSLRSAQEQLMASESRYRTLIESASRAHIGMAIIRNEASGQRLMYVNQGLAEISGFSKEELLNLDFTRLFAGSDRQAVKEVCLGGDAAGKPELSRRFQWTGRHGKTLFVNCTFAPAEYEGREAVVVFVRDISEQVRAEEQLKNHRLDLERTVEERTRDLRASLENLEQTQEQLIQSEKLASIGRLAAGIAHDFNNILQVIEGYCQVLLFGTPEQSPDREKLIQIRNAGHRAGRLVRQLLDFSREAKVDYRALDPGRGLEIAVKILERTIPKVVEIRLVREGNLLPVFADPVKLEQVILNLCSNAADAMPRGGRLTIEGSNVDLDEAFCRERLDLEPGRYLLVSVSDTGHGMDQETMQKIFEPFFTTKDVGKGTGLGLSSVYGIVKAHKGAIHCYSEPGKGTCFKVYLPAAEVIIGLPGRDETEGVPPARENENILVIDDDPDIRDLTVEMLESLGYGVICAENGRHGVEVFEDRCKEIGMVLLDMNMPVMGGRECMRELIRINPDVPVLIASGYSPNAQAADMISEGASGFIGKPYHFADLAGTVRDILDGRKD